MLRIVPMNSAKQDVHLGFQAKFLRVLLLIRAFRKRSLEHIMMVFCSLIHSSM